MINNEVSCIKRNPVFGVSNQARHKADCTATVDDWRLAILEVKGLYYLCSENNGADQLRDYILEFRI